MKSYALKLKQILILLLLAKARKKPRALVHLGPHKTGTSHVQFILTNVKKYLYSNNILNFDKCDDSHVSLSYYIGYKISDSWKESLIKRDCWYDRNAVRSFFDENLKERRDIIISSEFLFFRPLSEIEELMGLLDGFDVTFVSVYRQWLPHQFSIENQIVKGTSQPCFLEDWLLKPSIYYFYYLNNSNPIQLITGVPGHIVQKYDAKIEIIDYYGALDAGVDQVDVLFCFILRLPCENNKSFYPQKVRNKIGRVNRSEDLKKLQIMHILSAFVESKNCLIDLDKIIKGYASTFSWTLPLPTIEYDLSLYKNMSLAQDDFVRDHFNLLFGNRTSNENALKQLKYTEINKNIVKESPEWKMELIKAFEYFQHLGLITC